MQMRNPVKFNLSNLCALFNSQISQVLQAAFAPFNNVADFYCLDICNININKRGRVYASNNFFRKIQGQKRGIFIIFNEMNKSVLCIGTSENQDFYPSKANGGTRNSGVVRYINGDNPRMNDFRQSTGLLPRCSYEQYINMYSILFLCLTPAPSATTNFANDLGQLKNALETILHPQI